jgi:glutamyl-tRNA synthetase
LEDTDQNRFVSGAEANLIRTLAWAGIDHDEGPDKGGGHGPYRQSERLELYQQHAQQLVGQGDAYPCFCTPERLEQLRVEQQAKGETPRYDGHCRELATSAADERVATGEAHVIRMKVPETPEILVLDDLVRGRVAIETTQTEDQVIIKSDGFPTYHLAVVVDDHHMAISHCVRGEEWLPSFPKHLLLYRYLDWEPPQFAHLPLILNPDRTKLSKRQGDVAVEDFRDQGYLPETLINFIALLGWSPADDRELFSLAELVEQFGFEHVNRAGAVFDRDKLNWMNQQHLQSLAPEDCFVRLRPFIAQTPYAGVDEDLLRNISSAVQNRLVTLQDISTRLPLFLEENPELQNQEVSALLQQEDSQTVLETFLRHAEATDLNGETLPQIAKAVQQETGFKGRQLWLPLRGAITHELQGPDLHLLVGIFGKDKCLRLIRQALTC